MKAYERVIPGSKTEENGKILYKEETKKEDRRMYNLPSEVSKGKKTL